MLSFLHLRFPPVMCFGSGTTFLLKRIGVFPIRDHYYEPLFDDRRLPTSLQKERALPGIDLNETGQIEFIKNLCYSDELTALDLARRRESIDSFHINNGSFGGGDAEFLYQVLRHLKPAKVLEIGSGNSTKIARLALKRNKLDTGKDCNHICVEPYEQSWLESLDSVNVIRDRIENCAFDWTEVLDAGDVLFVDSSHIIRPQGDVLTEYLQIFPRLKSGVYVHIHDIFTPRDYPKSWIVDEVLFWNEQYLLEALLTNTNRYEVIGALNFLKHKHFDLLAPVCPYLTPEREPGSFYFRIKG
jgi:Methyltransferase domain